MTYEFNDCGVCINPDRIEIEKLTRIEIAEHNGYYIFGYVLDYNGGSSCSPCMGGERYKTRSECRQAAFDKCISIMKQQIEWYANAMQGEDNGGYGASHTQAQKVLAALQAKKNQNQAIQLELFPQ